jgi:hypothetical protein
VAAKYFLQQNNSPYYNQQAKEVTYYLFHYFGDAFSKVYTELPQSLSVSHDSILIPGDTIFTVATNENALICLTVNGEIIAVETCTGLPQDIIIPPQSAGDTMLVTVTKQNYYRYSRSVPVQQPTSIDETEKLIVEKFALFQNHPNPFNQTTIIQYSLKERSLVELVLFDVLGRRVEDLVVEEQDAGYYEVNFNAPKLSSGIYFYTVKAVPTGRQAGDPSTGSGQSFFETKKMVLMK